MKEKHTNSYHPLGESSQSCAGFYCHKTIIVCIYVKIRHFIRNYTSYTDGFKSFCDLIKFFVTGPTIKCVFVKDLLCIYFFLIDLGIFCVYDVFFVFDVCCVDCIPFCLLPKCFFTSEFCIFKFWSFLPCIMLSFPPKNMYFGSINCTLSSADSLSMLLFIFPFTSE